MIQEYIWSPDHYALDGSTFALIGLYDWLEYEPGLQCQFDQLVSSILPYYDAQSDGLGYSLFDLSHIVTGGQPNIQAVYHQDNTALVGGSTPCRPTRSSIGSGAPGPARGLGSEQQLSNVLLRSDQGPTPITPDNPNASSRKTASTFDGRGGISAA